MSYYLDIGSFFFTKKIWENSFFVLKIFLTLELKSVNSISSSFSKMFKYPINYFSQISTQMAPAVKFCTLVLLFFWPMRTLAKPRIKNVNRAQKMVNEGP